jgi:hypothetical protein
MISSFSLSVTRAVAPTLALLDFKLTFRTLWRSSGSFLSKLFWHPGAGSETQRIVTLSHRGSVSFAAYSQLPPIFVAHCCPPGGRSGDSALRPGALPRIINLRAARGDRLEVILLLSPRKVCTTSWGPLEGPPPELGGPRIARRSRFLLSGEAVYGQPLLLLA